MSWWRSFATLVAETVRSARPDLDSVGATEPLNWWLEDGEERMSKWPGTFRMPPRGQRYSLKPGDVAQLIFGCKHEQSVGAERMWVAVVSVNTTGSGPLYRGELHNRPVVVPLAWGASVEFDPKHVVGIENLLTHDPKHTARRLLPRALTRLNLNMPPDASQKWKAGDAAFVVEWWDNRWTVRPVKLVRKTRGRPGSWDTQVGFPSMPHHERMIFADEAEAQRAAALLALRGLP